MKAIPNPQYGLGPRPERLAGSSRSPHYVFMDAATIDALAATFPKRPSDKQFIRLLALSPFGDVAPLVIVTTPLELMLLDKLRGAHVRGKKVSKPKVGEFCRAGWGQLVIQSYPNMRTTFYLFQPFTIAELDVSHFILGVHITDIRPGSATEAEPIECPEDDLSRMKLRIEAFRTCAELLKAHIPDCTREFVFKGDRLCSPQLSGIIEERLGSLGDLHVDRSIDLGAVLDIKLKQQQVMTRLPPALPHPASVHSLFSYPTPDLADLHFDLRPIPQLAAPKIMTALPGYAIYLLFDTNFHSRFYQELLELTARLGPGIKIGTLPTVHKEVAEGKGGGQRQRSLVSFLNSAPRAKQYTTNQLQMRPATLLDVGGTLSKVALDGDLRIRAELSIVIERTMKHNPRLKHVFLFGTLDLGCYLLAGAVEPGAATLLLPRLSIEDKKDFVRIIFIILLQYLQAQS